MQIRGLRGLNGEAPIVDRQIALQELIRRVEHGEVREPHLFNHPILKDVKQLKLTRGRDHSQLRPLIEM